MKRMIINGLIIGVCIGAGAGLIDAKIKELDKRIDRLEEISVSVNWTLIDEVGPNWWEQ